MMKMLLAAVTGLAACAAPVSAHDWPTSQFSPQIETRSSFVEASPTTSSNRHRGGDRHGRRGHRDGGFVTSWVGYGGDWANYEDRSFEPDSYNDWWHDRPDRAFPRWVRNNQNCERIWWSGGGWRC